MAKEGFGNQWVEIARTGKFADSTGVERNLDADFLSAVAANYNAAAHEAPIVVGHPKDNVPAFGWAREVRLANGVLEARFGDTNDDFENLVRAGSYKKRSASFYTSPPNLRHVGFLGAQPPAVKGLRDISFSDGESVTISIEFNEEIKMPVKTEEKADTANAGLSDGDVDKVTNSVFDKLKNFLLGNSAAADLKTATANFSEAQVKEIAEATAKATTQDLLTKVEALQNENKTLRESVGAIGAQSVRSEITAFCESLGAEKITPALKHAGIVDFMAQLAADDAAAKTELVISFGEGDQKSEQKFSRVEWFKSLLTALPKQIEFGEKFGNLTVGTVKAPSKPEIDEDEVAQMHKVLGLPMEDKK